jgi:hypothetical protein
MIKGIYYYDASMYNILSTHEQEGEEEIHIYVDASPLTLRMSRCYLGKPNDSRSPRTEYFKGYDDDVENNNKVILVVKEQDFNLNKDDSNVGVDLYGSIDAINYDVDVYVVDSVVSGDIGANVDVYGNVKGVVRGIVGDDLDVDCSGDVRGVMGVGANVISVIGVSVDVSSVVDDGVDLSWVVGVTGDNMDSDSVKVRTFYGSKDGGSGGGDNDDNE